MQYKDMPHSPVALLHLKSLNWLTPSLLAKAHAKKSQRSVISGNSFLSRLNQHYLLSLKGPINKSALCNNFNQIQHLLISLSYIAADLT